MAAAAATEMNTETREMSEQLRAYMIELGLSNVFPVGAVNPARRSFSLKNRSESECKIILTELVESLDSPDPVVARRAFEVIYNSLNYNLVADAYNQAYKRAHTDEVERLNKYESAILEYTNILDVLPRFYSQQFPFIVRDLIGSDNIEEGCSYMNKGNISTLMQQTLNYQRSILRLYENLKYASTGKMAQIKIWPENKYDEGMWTY